jgi:hypothetical protein
MMRRRCFSCEALYSRSPLSGCYGIANVGFWGRNSIRVFRHNDECRRLVSRRLNKVRTKSRGQQSFASAVPLPGTRFRMLRHITTSSRNRAVTLPQLYSSFWSRIDPGYQASQHAYRSIATLLYFIHHAKPTHAFQFVFFSQPQFSP